ncbi:hypothetical protein BK666_07455 [Pseudomonas frederiksbergensis]|uniref:CBM-cenC domain-containing protein n=1 Tax=Pseudomonas frederiksbergensis TaxID=104087 RepID=A0A423KAF7_9PSED|nr:hypothetical protein [Pseudomonas frederiksbergensis]RON49101.1 hypothetical protein BK666_07455 [Pseudomonas frederiksbergensis]
MLIQPAKQLSPMTLLEPVIPGRTEPALPSGEWGINLAAARGNFPDKGMKVQIAIWSAKGLGDKVELLLNGAPVDQHTIGDPTEIGEPTILWVAPGRLPSGSYSLSYRVTRLNQAPETFDPAMRLYVKLELPGGQDLDPVEGQHSALYQYIDPQIVLDGVDKDIAKAGVEITVRAKPGNDSPQPYPNIAVGDVCTLSWGGQFVRSAPVTQEQIDDPAGHPIVITADEKTILDAQDTGPAGLAVTFMIRDLVNNQSEDWCQETRIVVDTGNSRLEAPIISKTSGNNLDLELVGDDYVVAQVWAESIDEFAKDDFIIMNLRGTPLEGEAVDVKVRQQILKTPPTVEMVSLRNADVRALAKTQAVFAYELERNGAVIQRSKGRFVNILGEPRRLAAPIAEDEIQGAIDPDLPFTWVRIPFDDAFEHEMAIQLKWSGTLAPPGGGTYEPDLEWYTPTPDEIDAKDDLLIMVEGRHLKILEGGTLALSYNLLLLDDQDEIVSRGSRPAALLSVGEPTLELDKPQVAGEEHGVLNPDELPNGVSQLSVPHSAEPTRPGDVVTYTWVGSVTGRTRDSIKITSHNVDQDLHFALNARFVAEHIEPNLDGDVTVWYEIARIGPPARVSYSDALVFSVERGFEPIVDYTDFADGTFGGWEPGPATDSQDWSIREADGNHRLFNNTFSNNSAGVVLKKTLTHLRIGKRYEFSIKAIRRALGGPSVSSLSLSTSQGPLTEPMDLPTTWAQLSGSFTAQTSEVEFRINSHVASGNGNDYEVDDLTIKRIQ